jgi:DNA mismatch endonuclease (patch repair protein)
MAAALTSNSWASSTATRSSMLSNRPKDTTPELRLAAALRKRRILHRRYQVLRIGDRRITVDFVIASAPIAVFVDGCFWHACPSHATWPKRNGAWWRDKLQANVQRDRRQGTALRRAGWRVLRVWAHVDPNRAAVRVDRTLAQLRRAEATAST